MNIYSIPTKRIVAGLLVGVFCLVLPNVGQAFTYNKNQIISNQDLTDYRSMSVSRVQSFLRSLGGALQGVQSTNNSGQQRSAAQLIVETSQRFQLNPKFFLVLIEKESGLVRARKTATQSLVDFALGYGCPDGSGCSQEYRGFGKQIEAAGNRFRNGYLADLATRGYTISGWGVGRTKTTVDGVSVTPQNEATAALYTYNPWVGKYGGGDPRWGANSLFAKLWDEWFKIHYPDGSLLRVRGEGGIWLIKAGKRHPFHSRSAFDAAYSLDHVIDVSLAELQAYPMGAAIKYPEFSLLQGPEGGVYLLADGKKRPIPSRAIFDAIGFNTFEIIQVTEAELTLYPTGERVESPDSYPTGILLQSRQNGGISYIENGVRHSIWSREILQNRFKYRSWKVVDQSEIDRYAAGNPVKFKDGEIVTSPGANGVYLISNGERRPIPSPDILTRLGLKWQNLIQTSDQALLRAHPLGARVDYDAS